MKKSLLIVCLLISVMSVSLMGCSVKVQEPLTVEGFKAVYDVIGGEVIELNEDIHTDKAVTMVSGKMHDVNITYYEMDSVEDANELFMQISDELKSIKESNVSTSSSGTSLYWLECNKGSYYLQKDSKIILYGTGFEDDSNELKYLMFKLGYYKYDTTYIKNPKEVNEQTFGY